jgi:hypothetical protein
MRSPDISQSSKGGALSSWQLKKTEDTLNVFQAGFGDVIATNDQGGTLVCYCKLVALVRFFRCPPPLKSFCIHIVNTTNMGCILSRNDTSTCDKPKATQGNPRQPKATYTYLLATYRTLTVNLPDTYRQPTGHLPSTYRPPQVVIQTRKHSKNIK